MSAASERPSQVLVVEDDPHLAAGVRENLRAEGYEVSAASDGEQALAWLRAFNHLRVAAGEILGIVGITSLPVSAVASAVDVRGVTRGAP